MRLERKVAIVTGGGQGIGRAIALTLGREGADVVIFDINLKPAKKVTNEIKSMGRQVLAIKCDVSNSEEVNRATKKSLNIFKKIDILVNNAAIIKPIAAEEVTEVMWDSTINVNLKGQFLCSQAIGRVMIKQRYGKIINIASLLAHVATPFLVTYGASKGGILQLTRVLAVEWAKYNINVNAVSPGMTETPMIDEIKKVNPYLLRDRVKRVPLRRLNKPEDIAYAVLFLASSESDNITGQTIIVDGGTCALNAAYVWPEE